MALVKYGAGIVQISGSIAGDVHARNRFGSYIRPRTKPVNPHSERQEGIRATISFLAERWHSVLDADQRGLWDTYAAAVPMTNRLGETIHLTGFNHYIRSNCVLRTWTDGLVDAAPTVLSLAEKDDTLQCTEELIGAQTFDFVCDPDGWLPNVDRKGRILLYQGQPQLKSRNQFDGPWRYMGAITPGEGALGASTQTAVFSFAFDQKVWFQARVFTNSGRCSQRWALNPRTIALDPP